MSKGLERLEIIKLRLSNNATNKECLEIIEKELKEAEENKKMLEIFKNALTIEHHEIPLELINSSDIHEFISGITKQITTIKENELDKKLRKSLREWVLKNAFPKELKALNEILALHDKWLGNEMSDFEFFTLLSNIKFKYGLKEVSK